MDLRELSKPLPVLGKWLSSRKEQLTPLVSDLGRSVPLRRVSMIIPAHNEEQYLARTLASLHRQTYRWFEVIVVANGCTDHTAEVARGQCQRLIIISQKSLGIARNLGARLARGELLVFLDADTSLEPMALRRVVEDFTQTDAAGTIHGRPTSLQFRYEVVYHAKNFLHRWSLHRGSSGVIICWKDAFERAGGFDEHLQVRENSELIRRLMKFGRYRYIGDVSATTSMRRYERRGFAAVLWLWARLWVESFFNDLRQRHYEAVR